ncbi:MAG: alpha/beta hydrolase [Acidobacteriota bacterium]|nr:alpha/beta hydrolase [Acidobacteriota bacterium]
MHSMLRLFTLALFLVSSMACTEHSPDLDSSNGESFDYGPINTETPEEQSGLITLASVDQRKRFILRHPDQKIWNGRLLVAAHGGTGGPSLSADGTEIGTAETSLDDLIGEHAIRRGYAYASVDRDGPGATAQGLAVVKEFAEVIRGRAETALGRNVERMYLVGLSMGGGIARYAAEDPEALFDGIVIIAGSGGDLGTQIDRLARRGALGPSIVPRAHPGLPDDDPKVQAYAATGAGPPVAARPLWPFIGASASTESLQRTLQVYGIEGLSVSQLENFRIEDYAERPGFLERLQANNTSGQLQVPTLEVVGTFDDFVLPEILTYKQKVIANPGSARYHRLYQVKTAWHISREDDALEGFRHRMGRMGFGPEVQQAAGEFGSYISTVQEALDFLDRWVTEGVPAPPDQKVNGDIANISRLQG